MADSLIAAPSGLRRVHGGPCASRPLRTRSDLRAHPDSIGSDEDSPPPPVRRSPRCLDPQLLVIRPARQENPVVLTEWRSATQAPTVLGPQPPAMATRRNLQAQVPKGLTSRRLRWHTELILDRSAPNWISASSAQQLMRQRQKAGALGSPCVEAVWEQTLLIASRCCGRVRNARGVELPAPSLHKYSGLHGATSRSDRLSLARPLACLPREIRLTWPNVVARSKASLSVSRVVHPLSVTVRSNGLMWPRCGKSSGGILRILPARSENAKRTGSGVERTSILAPPTTKPTTLKRNHSSGSCRSSTFHPRDPVFMIEFSDGTAVLGAGTHQQACVRLIRQW